MRRVVFDSTVLISAFLSGEGGLCHELLALARDGKFELVLSSAIILEALGTLMERKHIRTRYTYSDRRAYRFCRGLLDMATDVLHSTQPLAGIVRDPEDDMVLACALDGQADTIVSRDKDLLSLGTFQNIPIITPEVFRQQLRDAEQSG
jgi:putative PIN family toxin of toxin-antitoxin system